MALPAPLRDGEPHHHQQGEPLNGWNICDRGSCHGPDPIAAVHELELIDLVEHVWSDAIAAGWDPSRPLLPDTFLLSGYDGLRDTLSSMRRAGVRRVVLLSSSAAPGGDLTNAVARYHILSERAVRESGLAWTFLQPNTFMTNTFQWLPQLRSGDVIRAPFPDVRVATIDPADVGAVAAAALTSDAHEGRAYRLSGPESLLPADRVAILSAALGRGLRFEAQSNEEPRAEMSEAMPAEYVPAFFRFFADGDLDESEVLPTVEEVTGRPPRTFEEWVGAHAEALR